MGVSTDGLLYWGYELGEEIDWVDGEPWEYWEEGWEYAFAEAHGDPEMSWERRRELLNKEPCSIEMHCSYEYPMYTAIVSSSMARAWSGDPQIIRPEQLIVKPKWRSQLDEFCDLMGIDISDNEPGWWLASMWG